MSTVDTTIASAIDFSTSETQLMIADTIRKFAKEHIQPYIMEWDESQKFPIEVFKKLGELGFMGVLVPEEYGGAGFGYFEYVTAIVEIAKVDGSVGLLQHTTLFVPGIFYNLPAKNKRKNIYPNSLQVNGLEHGD